MSEWDFLWGLNGNELEEAMSSGGTAADWANIEEQEIRKRKEQWDKLKTLRDNEEISKEEFKKRKTTLFSHEVND